jgi:hypothetical protein
MGLLNGTGSWNAAATYIMSLDGASSSGVTFNWANAGTNLTTGSTYIIEYQCHGFGH